MVIKRMRAQWGLALATLFGLVITLSLSMSIPLYTDAVYYRVLREELARPNPADPVTRPPFAFLFRYQGSVWGTTTWGATRQVDVYLSEVAQADLRLPGQQLVRHFSTDPYRLFPAESSAYNSRESLTWFNLGFIDGLEENIILTEGRFPGGIAHGALNVLVSQAAATELGLQLNEQYSLFTPQEGVSDSQQIPVRIAGIWQPIDPEDTFWFSHPQSLDRMFLISEASYTNDVVPLLKRPVYLALWYWVLDGSGVRAEDAPPLLERTALVQSRADSLLRHTSLDSSPVEPLKGYRQQANQLTVLLFVFSLPIFGLFLAFIFLAAALYIESRRGEIATLRSRGATKGQMAWASLLEGGVLGAVAFVISLPLSRLVAGLMGQGRGYFNFSGQADFSTWLTNDSLRTGLFDFGLYYRGSIATHPQRGATYRSALQTDPRPNLAPALVAAGRA